MEKCKFCEAELEENSTVCPRCGKDNAAPVTEVPAEEVPAGEVPVEEAPTGEVPAGEVPAGETPAEEPAREKLSAGKTILALAAVVVAIVLLAAIVMNGRKPAETEAPVETQTETVEATVPADGNPDDVTCKGTYTAADEDVIAARDVVVATAGDHELTLSQLQVYYWMELRNFMSQYGAYAAYFGLDIQQPLDTQMCGVMETPMTWQQYFLHTALNSWQNYTSMASEGMENGYELPELQTTALAEVGEELNAAALQNGFESGDDMLHRSLGNAVDLGDYRAFMETYYRANGYYNALCDTIRPTAQELEAFFDEHADGYAQSGITKDSIFVNVRHILVYPEGADSTTVRTEEFSEEAWAAGEAAAQAILDAWLAGDATEESFAALANEHSQDPGSNTNGGLYENVTAGQMVQSFNDWCFDSARQVGDTGVVRTEYGFHVMYFAGSRPMWSEYAESDFISETANKMAGDIAAKYPLTVKYDTILLGSVELT